jgi:hypothetical protein
MKDLKQSTKQRFGGLDFDYPETALEVAIVTQCITHIGIIGEWRNHGHRTRRFSINTFGN